MQVVAEHQGLFCFWALCSREAEQSALNNGEIMRQSYLCDDFSIFLYLGDGLDERFPSRVVDRGDEYNFTIEIGVYI